MEGFSILEESEVDIVKSLVAARKRAGKTRPLEPRRSVHWRIAEENKLRIRKAARNLKVLSRAGHKIAKRYL